MELSHINLRQVALIVRAHGERFADSTWYSNAPVETQSRLMFVQDGKLDYRINGKRYTVTKNQLILMPENRHLEYKVPKNELVHLRYCNFTASFGNKSIFDYLEGDWVTEVDKPEGMIELFRRFDYVDETNIIKDFINKKLCLVSILDEFLSKSNLNISNKEEEEGLDLSGLVDFIKRDIHTRDIVNVEYLAKMMHVHPSHLSREFKKRYGKPPMQFVLDERAEAAKKLLSNSKLSIGDIAENMHFENSKYFSKFFKRRTGMTPSEYRKQSKRKK